MTFRTSRLPSWRDLTMATGDRGDTAHKELRRLLRQEGQQEGQEACITCGGLGALDDHRWCLDAILLAMRMVIDVDGRPGR